MIADTYKCITEDGHVTFQSRVCTHNNTQEIIKRTSEYVNSPSATVKRFFFLIKHQNNNESYKLFLTRNSEQKGYVRKYIKKGIEFFAKASVKNKVIKTFKNGVFAVVAIEQSSPELSGYEIEPGFLILYEKSWLILPDSGDYLSKVNRLTEKQKAKFKPLLEKFNRFKHKTLKLRSKIKGR